MAVSLTDKGITVGGTVTNIVTEMGSTIFGYGSIYRYFEAKGGESYTLPNTEVGGVIYAGRRYYQTKVTISLPSSGTYLVLSETQYSTGDLGHRGMELTPSNGTVYSGGSSFNCPSKSGNYSHVFVLAFRLT